MHVFVTGASGHLGSGVVPELLAAGHRVTGLARSDASASALSKAGAEVRRGDLDDLAGLREAAAGADGVIHLAYKHDLALSGAPEDFVQAAAHDLRVTQALGEALGGSNKPLITTSGTALLAYGEGAPVGRPGTEADSLPAGPRIDSENAVIAFAKHGVRSAVVRLPPTVHSSLDHTGFLTSLIKAARKNGFVGYVGDGQNRWPAVHTLDAARLYRLAVEKVPAGTRLHAVADAGVAFREIAEALARGLGLPARSLTAEEAPQKLGFFARFVQLDNPSSSAETQRILGWAPTHPALLPDLAEPHYFV